MQVQIKAATVRNANAYAVHDLLRLRALPSVDDAPGWLLDAFATAPMCVVRRAEAPPGFVAVGFRGSSRSDRYGTFVATDTVLSAYSPEALLHARIGAERETLKVFAALRQIVEEGRFGSLAWGPTGSVGFELATGQPTATHTSDLDLVVRTPTPLARMHARSLRGWLDRVERDWSLRIDVQLETPLGGIALNEWVEDKPHVMVRSSRGPSLVSDPWAAGAAPCEGGR